MKSNPLSQSTAATALPDRVAALELFVQQLVFVLDAQGAMNADALMRWIDLARARMLATGSATPAQVRALARLAKEATQ